APVAPVAAVGGEQIYQLLLKSTVWIESDLGVAALPPGDDVRLAGFPGGIPVPGPPNFGPKLGPKLGPPLGGTSLANTAWEGNETLAGYGRLRFEFTGRSQVIMIDARSISAGTRSEEHTSELQSRGHL